MSLNDRLRAVFPLLYRQCGVEVGDGWGEILWDLSSKLEPMLAALPEDERPCAAQVKEKFGALRFYLTSGTPEMYSLIDLAELQSTKVCEDCGQPGVTIKRGWWKTLCPEHAANHYPQHSDPED